MNSDEALAQLRERLTGQTLPAHEEGEAKVTFHLHNGFTVVLDNIAYDDIGDDLSGNGVISAENFHTGEMFHIPYVAYWTVDARV